LPYRPKSGYPTQSDMFDALATHYWAGKEWSAKDMAEIIERMEAHENGTEQEPTNQAESPKDGDNDNNGTDEIDWDRHLGADQTPYAWNGWNYRD